MRLSSSCPCVRTAANHPISDIQRPVSVGSTQTAAIGWLAAVAVATCAANVERTNAREQAMIDPFTSRMADLDALVEKCRGEGAFATGIVRDTSNRSNRDWKWWSVEIERTDDKGLERRRTTAEIFVNEPAPGVPSVFKGSWSARIWQGVSKDSFAKRGGRSLSWETPSAKELDEALASLLSEAEKAINEADQSGS